MKKLKKKLCSMFTLVLLTKTYKKNLCHSLKKNHFSFLTSKKK